MRSMLRRFLTPGFFILMALSLASPAQAEAQRAPTAQIPACIVGTWRVADLPGMFRAILADSGIQMDSLTGEIRLVISGGGSYELTYGQVTMTSTMEGLGPSTMIFDGWGRGALREVRPGVLMGSTTDSSVTVTFNSGDLSFSNSSTLPTGEEQVDFSCEASRIRFYVSVPADENTERNLPVDFIRAN